MKSFTLILQDATRHDTFNNVTSFVGEDSSGSFGLLANHTRFVTSLVVGLARFRVGDEPWKYLALPGAVLQFHDTQLTVSTRRYWLDDDYMRISQVLQDQLLAEEEKLHSIKASLHHMEQEILKRLWETGRRG